MFNDAPVTLPRLYLRCLGWGLATGAFAGGLPAAVIGLLAGAGAGNLWLALLLTSAGLFYGVLVAILPTVVGGLAVVAVLHRRHPRPASFEAIQRDLAIVFGAVVAVLDIAVLALWVLLGGWDTLGGVAVVLVVLNALVCLVLVPARSSIARAWVGGPEVRPHRWCEMRRAA